jgi:microcystin-dependent protein
MSTEPYIGQISIFAGNFAPKGWALCNGQLLSIAQNTALFSILGTTYGGNGQTTFALPNLQGRVPIHAGQLSGGSNYSLGEEAGTETVTLLSTQMPAHTHTAVVSIAASEASQAPTADPSGAFPGADSGANAYSATSDGTKMNASMATATVAAAGGNQPFSIQQPFLCLNFIIALQGIFPSRN